MFKKIFYLAVVCISLIAVSCKGNRGGSSNETYKDQVVIHTLSDFKGLNPVTSSDAQAQDAVKNIYQSLLDYNFETLKLIPVLATEVPQIVEKNGGAEITYEIRPEAVWDNGSPVTADDYIFSLKSCIAPKVVNEHISTLEDVVDIVKDPTNNRKFTVVFSKVSTQLLDASGTDVRVMPEYVFDPKGVLRKYTIKQLQQVNSPAENDPAIIEFAEFFNGEKANRDPKFVNGSGAYKLESWQTDQRIVMERKQNWWGDKLQGTSQYFDAYPKKLVYEVINDFNTALTALKDQKLDVIYVTPVKDYVELDNSSKFKANFSKSEPDMLSYQYIGINTRDKILSDKKVRQAIAHLVNVDQTIDKVLYGNGFRIVGPVLKSSKEDYNDALKPIPYDVETAKKLLAEAGWKDTDGDGILDKVINGQKTDFKIRYDYNSGNPIRESVGLFLQQWLKQAGIELEVKAMDWSLYLDELRKGNSQLFYGAWIMDPRPYDFTQIWHTSSKNGGSNYTGFGTAETDKMIEAIRTELDPVKRAQMIKDFQEILQDETAYIFLYGQNFRNVVHKRFENINPGPVYPGYWAAGFKVKEGYKVEGKE